MTAQATREWRQQSARLAHSQKNSHNDPVCVALVLDLLLRLEHDHRIHSRNLATLLNEEYPQVIWDTVTVGKIMSCLADAAKGSGAPDSEIPIERGVSNGGRFFALRPTAKNWRWLASARHAMGAVAEKTIAVERKLGAHQPRHDFPWEVFADLAWGQ